MLVASPVLQHCHLSGFSVPYVHNARAPWHCTASLIHVEAQKSTKVSTSSGVCVTTESVEDVLDLGGVDITEKKKFTLKAGGTRKV